MQSEVEEVSTPQTESPSDGVPSESMRSTGYVLMSVFSFSLTAVTLYVFTSKSGVMGSFSLALTTPALLLAWIPFVCSKNDDLVTRTFIMFVVIASTYVFVKNVIDAVMY